MTHLPLSMFSGLAYLSPSILGPSFLWRTVKQSMFYMLVFTSALALLLDWAYSSLILCPKQKTLFRLDTGWMGDI